MKKQLTAILMASILAVIMPLAATPALAQTRSYVTHTRHSNERNVREGRGRYNEERATYNTGTNGYYNNGTYNSGYYDNGTYNNGYYNGYGQPSVYDRHRKAINIGVATGAGAVIGALIGGKKGAAIGAAAGVATGAIITAKQAPRNYSRY